MLKNYKLITVIGNVGSGKSTLTNLLAKKLKAKKIPADELYKVNPFFPLTVKDRKRWSLPSDLWFLNERVKMAKKYPVYLKKNHVVVDSGIPMSWIYANSRMQNGFFTHQEWKLYSDFYQILTKEIVSSAIIVYLKADEKFLLERINKRGREFEIKFFNRRYLKCLNDSIEDFLKIQNPKTKILCQHSKKNYSGNGLLRLL